MSNLKNRSKDLSCIHLEDTPFHMDWMAFQMGSSFFLPCCKCIALRNEILSKATRAGAKVACKLVIEKGVRGVRTWRVI